MACREPADVAQGPEDGTQRDGGCCAGGRQVLRRTTADGLQGVARCCAVCCRWFVASWQVARKGSKDAAPEASGWCVEGRRVASRRRSGTIFGTQRYSPFRQKGYSSGETGLLSIIPSYLKKSVDEDRANEDTDFRCETRRYLSWIEGLTTNQYVGGSNPSRRTIETAGHRGFCLGGFLFSRAHFVPWVLFGC